MDISKKHYFLSVTTEYIEEDDRAILTRADVIRLDGKKRFTIDGENVLQRLFEKLTNLGAAIVWLYDMSYFGMFCDYYALKNNLKPYKEAEKRQNTVRKSGAKEECYSILYVAGRGVLDFRLTLKRTAKTHEYGGGNIGGLHTVEYRGLKDFFNNQPFQKICNNFKIDVTDELEAGRELVLKFFKTFSKLAGEGVTTLNYLRNVYTISGAAKRAYLKIRYPKGSLATYQKEHFADEEGEDYLRCRKLQLSGMCFFPVKNKEKLITDKVVYKYDVNGLYSYTANSCGELSYPKPATYKEFMTDRTSDVTYILVVKNFIAYRKENMPNVFTDPFATDGGNVLQITEEWAVFRELWDTLRNFYDFEEYDVIRVLKCQKKPDKAIQDYNNRFQQFKEYATQQSDEMLRALAKSFLNNLIGKFTQRTKYVEIIGQYNATRDMVEFIHGKEVNNWERGRFDYIRGAYIYTMARVRVMLDIYNLLCEKGDGIMHHFYTDTDSICTDIQLPTNKVDAFRLGAYKLEETFTAFGVLGKKCYYGRTINGEDKLTAAGLPKGLVMAEIDEMYGKLTPVEVWSILKSDATYEVKGAYRCRGGGVLKPMRLKVHDLDIDKLY